VLLYDACWYDIPYHDTLPVAMTYYLRKHSMLRHTASCSKIICYDIVCCCDIVHAVSWHVISYAVTYQVSVVATDHGIMHCMLLSYNIWHSACCDISCHYDIVTVCCWEIPSSVMWHVFRPFENIMFQSFIILLFFSYLSFH
jgi:hypothetical protein